MTRKRAVIITVALVAMMVLASATMAFAAPVVSLTSTRTVVTYPHGSWVEVGVADGDTPVATPITVQYRPAWSDQWKTLRTVPASVTALGVTRMYVGMPYLRVNTGFRAVADELVSDVTTISVCAKLSQPISAASIKGGRNLRIKGYIWPRHKTGSRPVDVKLYKLVNKQWVLMDTVHPAIVGSLPDGSKWAYTLQTRTADKGWWKVTVEHEDANHVASVLRASRFRVR